jgi:hypothetical protein
MRGEAAIAALGGRLRAAALAQGVDPAGLAAGLREEPALWLDRCGLRFYSDELPALPADAPADAPAAPSAPAWPAAVSPADALALHSRPGSPRTLFLDFDGHTIAGTGWNATYGRDEWAAPAFSIDGDPVTFSEVERAVVIDVWRRVAQDFAPFDVDVTTEDPGDAALTRADASDQQYGTRVLISPDSTQELCGCGGRAYVDVFDRSVNHGYTQPAWVYPHVLGNTAKYIADAASHEAGHTLGLTHDGTTTSSYYGGSGGWGPLMGSPYAQAITQWSDGSYPNASNSQDDVALLAANGVPLVADDAPDLSPDALPVDLGQQTPGIVNSRADVDWYSVTVGAGALVARAAPYWPGPNADLGLVVADGSGQVLASSAPVFAAGAVESSVAASITLVVPAGTYRIGVEGTGNGLPGSAGESDYGSLGWYTVTVTGGATPGPDPSPSPSPTPSASPPPAVAPTPTASAPVIAPQVAGPAPPVAVAAEPLRIATTSVPRASRRTPYATQLVAVGGVGPVRWVRVKGKLPKGLRLTSAGLITGTPKVRASKKVRIRATDAAGTSVTGWIRIRVR